LDEKEEELTALAQNKSRSTKVVAGLCAFARIPIKGAIGLG
jgi:hypothetical protein